MASKKTTTEKTTETDTAQPAAQATAAPPAATQTALVPTPEETALATAADFAEYAGAGLEGITADEISIPFVSILQALSPQLEANTALRAGMLINTITGDSFDGKTGIEFIPATRQHFFVEWKPRKEGGGFVAQHDPGSKVVADAKAASTEFGKYKTPAGNDLIETFYVYGIGITPSGERFQAALAFKSTQIKKYKSWMTRAMSVQIQVSPDRRIAAPLFAHRYSLKTVSDKNPKGTFHNWEIAFAAENAPASRLSPKSEDFLAAVAIRDAIASGKARAAVESEASVGHEENGEGLPVDKSGKALF